MAADWLLALTPGGVDQALLRLGHHKVARPLYPFDEDAYEDGTGPDLTPVLLRGGTRAEGQRSTG
jgi:hypothetical protein